MWIKRHRALLAALILVGSVVLTVGGLARGVAKEKTVADRLAEYGGVVRSRLSPKFKAAGVAYPPARLAYVVFKDTGRFEVYAKATVKSTWKFVAKYPVLRASGVLGPKLREGDNQVPEGIYRLELLNPNSQFHLSLRVGYPNAFDRRQAASEGRTKLGGDIMIHGSNVSIGCVAMGDKVAEDLFVLAAIAGIKNVEVVISPTDFRLQEHCAVPTSPTWLKGLYDILGKKLSQFPRR